VFPAAQSAQIHAKRLKLSNKFLDSTRAKASLLT
jgi:hypothetical protein